MEDLLNELKECAATCKKQEFMKILSDILSEMFNKYKEDDKNISNINKIYADIESLVKVDDVVAILDILEYELIANY